MKKLMALLMAVTLVMPFANVKAEDTITDCSVNSSCFVYTPGDEVNFYRNEEERKLGSQNAGITTFILEDAGASSLYVRTLAIAAYGTNVSYYDANTETAPLQEVKKGHISSLFKTGDYYWNSAKQDAEGNIELDYITLNDLINVFGASENADGTYSIDATKWGSKFILAAVGSYASKGFYTSTYDLTTKKVWAVEYTMNDAEDTITAITVKQVSMDGPSVYGYLPVVSFNKTYDCHSRTQTVEMACYSCDDDYRWLKVGEQAQTCTLVENVTKQASCVKAVKTGVEDYIFEFAGVCLVCGAVLFIVKKKDLFRSI